MAFAIISARLPTGDTPIVGVCLQPYVLIKRGDATVTADDVPEEGSGEGQYQLRSRWYRSTLTRGGAVCAIHPDKEATIQCVVCLKTRTPQHLSYHCTPECLKSSWQSHIDYHKQSHANGGASCSTDQLSPLHQQGHLPNGASVTAGGENGHDAAYFKSSSAMYSNGETWVEVRPILPACALTMVQ